jgi:hypothetical protein
MELKMDWFRSNLLSLERQYQGINGLDESGASSYSEGEINRRIKDWPILTVGFVMA